MIIIIKILQLLPLLLLHNLVLLLPPLLQLIVIIILLFPSFYILTIVLYRLYMHTCILLLPSYVSEKLKIKTVSLIVYVCLAVLIILLFKVYYSTPGFYGGNI